MSSLDEFRLYNLVKGFNKKGVKIWLDSSQQLRYSAPKGILNQSDIQQLIANKEAIVDLLLQQQKQKNSSQLVRVVHRNKFALSANQKGLWQFLQGDVPQGMYNVPLVYRLQGKLYVSNLIKSLQYLISRYEILRTKNLIIDNEPQQIVEENVEVPFFYQKMTEINTDKDEWIKQITHQPISMTIAPLFRVHLLEEENNHYTLVWVIHHIIIDSWSLDLLMREFWEAYINYNENKEPSLALVNYQYIDFSSWQNQLVYSDQLDETVKYWQNKLKDITPVFLPAKNRLKKQTYNGKREFFQINNALVENINKVTYTYSISEHVVLLAAYYLLLNYYTQQSDLIVGSSFANREYEEFLSVIGFLINPVPLRINLYKVEKIQDLFSEVNQLFIEAREHQKLPFDRLLSCVKFNYEKNRAPIFQTMFDYSISESDTVEFPGLVVKEDRFQFYYAKFELSLSFKRIRDFVEGIIEYNTDLFDEYFIKNLAEHYQKILKFIVTNPQSKIGDIDILNREEKDLLLYQWNSTDYLIDPHQTIVTNFFQQVKSNPNKVAVSYNHESINYQELEEKSNKLANYLLVLGSKSEDIIGICLNRSIDTFVAILAVLKIGATYLPLDPSYPKERIGYMLSDAKVNIVITNNKVITKLNVHADHLVNLDSDYEFINLQNVASPNISIVSSQLAYLIYTSGSTGKPKGVMISHSNVLNYTNWFSKVFMVSKKDTFDFSTSVSFDLSVTCSILPLLQGCTVAICDDEVKKDPVLYLNHLEEKQISFSKCTPSYFIQMCRFANGQHKLESLRFFILGGEALQVNEVKEWLTRYQHHKIVNEYGPTETTVATAAFIIDVNNANKYLFTYPIGKPAFNTKLYILDSNGRLCPIGIPGELYISGKSVSKGYFNKPELTAERFLQDPFFDANKMYKTGDIACWLPEGIVNYLGRVDEQIKIRGYRIEPAEIVQTINAYPNVIDNVVIAKDDKFQNKHLIAYYIEKKPIEIEGLRNYLYENLPEYMVPAFFIRVDKFPLNNNNKLDTNLLPDPYLNYNASKNFIPPISDQEKKLTIIWESVLNVAPIGVEDNFFELGGDSISALQVIAKGYEEGIYLTVMDIFESNTIASLVSKIKPKKSVSPEQGFLTGRVNLLPIQHWFFDLKLIENNYWNQVFKIKWNGNKDIEKLNETFKILVKHHDAFRLCFVNDNSIWEQYYLDKVNSDYVECITLQQTNSFNYENTINKHLQAMQSSLDLEKGALIKAVVFNKINGNFDEHFYIIAHHLIIDAFSWKILLEDLNNVYHKLINNCEVSLPEKTSSLRQWANYLSEKAMDEKNTVDLSFWQKQLSNSSGELPLDYQGKNIEASMREFIYKLDTDSTSYLVNNLTAQTSLKINDILVTALLRVLKKHTENRIWVLNFDSHGRETLTDQIDLSRTIGWFTNMYPLSLEISETGEILQDLKLIKDKLLIIPNKGLSYGMLRYLNSDTSKCGWNNFMPQLAYNYLGKFSDHSSEKYFNIVSMTSGFDRGPQNIRPHLLDLNCFIQDNNFIFYWLYSQNIHAEITVKNWAKDYIEEIENLIIFCRAFNRQILSSGDFPFCKLNQHQLDKIVSKYPQLEEILPATSIQQGFLFHHLYHQNSDDYLTQLTWDMYGKLDVLRFKKSWESILQKYSVLRTAFIWEEMPQPLQVIEKDCQLHWNELDWSNLDVDKEQMFKEYIAKDRTKGFDLSKAPLLRLSLIKLSEDKFRLIWSYDHLIFDGWSTSIILKDLFALYEVPVNSVKYLEKESISFADYVKWLSSNHIESKTFWCEYLDGFKNLTGFPMSEELFIEDKDINHGNIYYLSTSFTNNLIEFSRKNAFTLNTLVQASWAFLLSQYSNESDVVFGVTVSGRNVPFQKVNEIVGMFINTLPLRVKCKSMKSIIESLVMIQENMRIISQYETSSLAEIGEWVGVSASNLLNTNIVFENYPVEDKVLSVSEQMNHSDQILISRPIPYVKSGYPLTLVIIPGKKLGIQFSYKTCYFSTKFIERLREYFLNTLKYIIDNPQKQFFSIEYLSLDEKKLLELQLMGPKVVVDNKFVYQQISDIARRVPKTLAIVEDEKKINYGELNESSNRLAHYLRSKNVKPDTFVAIYSPRSALAIVAMLAVNKAGGAYVPLDIYTPSERIKFILEDTKAEVLITEREYLSNINAHHDIKHVILLDELPAEVAEQSKENPININKPQDLMYVMYTSGSTGTPKGVLIEHQSVCNYVQWASHFFINNNGCGVPVHTSLAFDITITAIYPPLVCCHPLYIIRENKGLDGLIEILSESHVYSLIKLTPTHLKILQQCLPSSIEQHVNTIVVGGELLEAKLIESLIHKGACIINEYGPTEATVGCIATQISCKSLPKQGGVPIGMPINNTNLYVLNDECQVSPIGVIGNLYIGGAGLARGYLNNLSMTEEHFVELPFTNQRYYKSGDLVKRLEDGSLEFIGRRDNQVKFNGYRIELNEIEQCLQAHEDIKQVAVILNDINNDKQLIAYYQSGEFSPSKIELREYLKEFLPEYMIPNDFIEVSEIPMTGSGKVDQKALTLIKPLKEIEEQASFILPKTNIEEKIHTVWCAVLNKPKISIQDNFLDLGGHSLKAVQIITRLNELFKVNISLKLLFESRTIEKLAENLEIILDFSKDAEVFEEVIEL